MGGDSGHSNDRRHRHDDSRERSEDEGDKKHSRGSRRHHKRRDKSEGDDDDERRHKRRRDSEGRHHHRRHRHKEEDRRHRHHSKERSNDKPDGGSLGEEDKKRRRRHDDDEDSYRRQRHKRDRKDHVRKKEKMDKKDKKKKKEKSKHRQDHSQKKHKLPKKPDQASLYPMPDPLLGHPPETLIYPEKDYFSFHQQFWVYLYREEGIAFNDLTSEEARVAFERFVKRYNAGDLQEPYYSTLPPEVIHECKTTKHTWSFQTSATERKGLQVLQQGIREQTEYSAGSQDKVAAAASADATSASVKQRHQEEETARFRRKSSEERLNERRAHKRLKDHVRNSQEEIIGGPKDLRERQIEKRKEQSERMHGAHRDKEAAGVELSDSAIFGEDTSLQAALGRQRRNKEHRSGRQKERIEELQNKERERQEKMMKMLGLQGLKPGQKITIAPRKDG